LVKKKFAILLFGFSLCFSGWQSVSASHQTTGIEKGYYDLGFKSVSEAAREAEAYYKTNLDLPHKLPPLAFTHSFGRFTGEGDQNDGLEVVYLNEEKHFNYIINVRPAKYGKKFNSTTDSKITLKDGTQAYYNTVGKDRRILVVFMFEKDGWGYMLSIQKNLLDKPISTLVEIANSLQ
jgi:hypothetical protein